jgi:hypothetical protein
MTLFEKICRMVGDRRIPSPKMPAFRWFTVGFANKHVTTVVVMAIVVSGLAVAVGLYFAVRDVMSSTYNWPEPAEYQVTAEGLQTMGKKNPDYPDGTASQTLRVGFKDGTRVDRVVLKNLDLGKVGLAKSFEITRNATTGVTGTQAYLFIGDIIITNSSAPTLAWGNMELGSVTLSARVDGHSQEIQQDSTISQIIIDSDRGSGTYTAQDSKVDRVILQINGATKGASIGVLEIDNVDASVGSWSWDYVKAGSLSLDGSNEFGNSTGINVASATWADTISARTIVDNLVDVPISVK